MTSDAYNKLLRKFDRLPAKKKVEVLFDALAEMQAYNGRTSDDCIVIAMGGDYVEEG